MPHASSPRCWFSVEPTLIASDIDDEPALLSAAAAPSDPPAADGEYGTSKDLMGELPARYEM